MHSQQSAVDNHTEGASGLENSANHSNDIDIDDDDAEDHTFVHETDRHYVAAGPTDWADVEVKKLGRRKPPEHESSTNEQHSYHIDLSAYYASSQTVSTTTSNLLTTVVTASLVILCTAAH